MILIDGVFDNEIAISNGGAKVSYYPKSEYMEENSFVLSLPVLASTTPNVLNTGAGDSRYLGALTNVGPHILKLEKWYVVITQQTTAIAGNPARLGLARHTYPIGNARTLGANNSNGNTPDGTTTVYGDMEVASRVRFAVSSTALVDGTHDGVLEKLANFIFSGQSLRTFIWDLDWGDWGPELNPGQSLLLHSNGFTATALNVGIGGFLQLSERELD